MSRAKLLAVARRLHDPNEAEDLVQEALLRLQLRGHEDLRSIEAWLATTVRNAAIDARRRAAVERRLLTRVMNHPATASSPSETVDLEGRADRLVRALVATVGAPTTAALLLRHVFDVPYEDLARETGRTAVGWRQHLHRALDRLRNEGLSTRSLEEDEAIAAARCRSALATADLARLHAFVRTTTIARAGAAVGTPTHEPGRTHATLALVDGRYVLALVLDGIVLCAVPVGADETSVPLA